MYCIWLWKLNVQFKISYILEYLNNLRILINFDITGLAVYLQAVSKFRIKFPLRIEKVNERLAALYTLQ